ncbi:putative glycoside hydrolase [Coraliomargarita sp. SDUM461004]|uniref:Glycoside hydrolase n=1 Tax=Thalassobacterium sedimentorum TaxID=3041258 RepID=A0ABU1AN88_9BACT|nr:putative glycoside hydrolase [Coraliomargarita sp. SDUM461004]MDQ8196269.1 putative glycoside hydrolase [Coraliomargarita sp. SDUM461004]
MKKLLKISLALLLPSSVLVSAAHNVPFDWDTVPVYAHLANMSDDFTPEQLDFLAENFDLITIEKGHAKRKHGSTEKGFALAVDEIKKRNPDAKVLFYWNSSIKIGGYDAIDDFPQDGELLSKDGELLRIFSSTFSDLSQPEVQRWWSDTASRAVHELGADGVFIDAIGKFSNHRRRKVLTPEKVEALNNGLCAMVEETRRQVGSSSILIQNGVSMDPENVGARLLQVTDGAMKEHFVSAKPGKKEALAEDIEVLQTLAKSGKLLVIKAWPGFDWRDKEIMQKSREERIQMAREAITFPLACYLLVAQPYSYFCYTWSYQGNDTGTFVTYPEFDKPLGPPQGDAQRDGWKYTRDFAHASVFVDLETWSASIDWK